MVGSSQESVHLPSAWVLGVQASDGEPFLDKGGVSNRIKTKVISPMTAGVW